MAIGTGNAAGFGKQFFFPLYFSLDPSRALKISNTAHWPAGFVDRPPWRGESHK